MNNWISYLMNNINQRDLTNKFFLRTYVVNLIIFCGCGYLIKTVQGSINLFIHSVYRNFLFISEKEGQRCILIIFGLNCIVCKTLVTVCSQFRCLKKHRKHKTEGHSYYGRYVILNVCSSIFEYLEFVKHFLCKF